MAQILLVDDEADMREIVSRYLVRSGHRITCASDGQEALQRLLMDRPELVTLDVRMPNLDGVGLLEIMRSYLRWNTLPVILVTGLATSGDTRRARDLGVCHILHKSQFKLEHLDAMIDECLKRPS